MTIEDLLGLGPVIPVLVVEDVASAAPLARALAAGGLKVLEITLRTPAALDGIHAVAQEVEEVIVGAGTVLTGTMREAAARAGARFVVSPGLIDGEGVDGPAPLLPGVATPTELMRGLAAGFTAFKLFPAHAVGGLEALKAYQSTFPQARFCPTGGITAANAADYLALPNVACVGGSWVAPVQAVRDGDWTRITTLARQAAALGGARSAPEDQP